MRFILYFLLLVAPPVWAQDADFLAAYDAFRAGDKIKLQRLVQRLKNKPLEVYLNYYQLRLELDRADTQQVLNTVENEMRKFLSRTEDTPMIDQLRGEWLKWLASHQQWKSFDAEYPRLLKEDVELSCYALQSRLRRQHPNALRQTRALWLNGKELPESCNVPFEAAIAAGIITEQDVSQRLRLALESGNVSLAKKLFARVDGYQAVSASDFENAARDALQYLDKLKLDDVSVPTKSLSNARIEPPPQQPVKQSNQVALHAAPEYSYENIEPLTTISGRKNLATACLNFAHVLPIYAFPILGMQQENSSHIDPGNDSCEMFALPAVLAKWRKEAAVTDQRVAKNESGTASNELSVLSLPEEKMGVTAGGAWSGWEKLLRLMGLGQDENPATTVKSDELQAAVVCDLCQATEAVSTVTPMQWNARLDSEGQRAVALFAMRRLAKQSAELAAIRWMKIAAYFSLPEQHYFYGWLGYEAARNHDGRALQWYKAAANTPLTEQQSAWRVRAALRALDWPEVLASINAMSELQQRDATWRYWKARALQAMDKPIEARNLYIPLSGEFHFYAQLASEELANTPVLSKTQTTYKPDRQMIVELSALPGIQRTLVLYRLGLRSEALEEWRWAIRNFNDRELLAAAEIARRNEMYDRAIGAADKTISEHDFSLRYLAPYREELKVHIREHALDEAWVYGLMRQESRFVTNAKSSVGAAGLMQIMPATARWVASKLGLKSYRNALIHQLDTNLKLGTYYMKTVLAQFDDSPVLASAAYNAGPRRAREWRGERPMEGAIYAETIPFDETRDYVKKVMSNTMYYASQFNAPPRSLKQRIGMVASKAEDKRANVPSDQEVP